MRETKGKKREMKAKDICSKYELMKYVRVYIWCMAGILWMGQRERI